MTDTGNIVFLSHKSEVLKDNPLGDPYQRTLPVYTPPGYDPNASQAYPVIFGLTGFTGAGEMYLNKSMLKQPFNELLDDLILNENLPPVLYAMPNCMTYYGGSQYINSSAVGNYEDYIIQELVPLVDNHFKTTGKRAVMGGSSGGIGAFTLAAKYPEVFQAFADHSGDSAFEYCYLADVPKFITAIEKYDGSLEKFKEAIYDHSIPKDNNFMAILGMMAMSACYSPNPDAPLGFELPFDSHTGKLFPEIWERWLAFDPVHMAERYQDNLKKLSLVYLDCGTRDQFNLLLGARQLRAELQRLGIEHTYEEYNSDHFLMRRAQKRKSIPLLVKAIG